MSATDVTYASVQVGDQRTEEFPALTRTMFVKYAGAYAQGLRDAGLLPVLKHFPGHGHGSGDSHTGSVVTPPIADLQTNDLIPYRTLAAQAPVGVMVGHLEVPGLTGSDPASLSPAAYALLRSGDYGGPAFNGPVLPTTCPACRPSVTGSALPRRPCAGCRPARTRRCG